MENKMFCFQCQETAGCSGCTRVGVCGKSASTAVLQDLLIYATKGLCEITTALRRENKNIPHALNQFICENLFITITNANFDDEVISRHITKTLSYKEELFIAEEFVTSLSPDTMGEITHIHRPLSQYIQELYAAGLQVKTIDEPYPVGEIPPNYSFDFPRFLFVLAVKGHD